MKTWKSNNKFLKKNKIWTHTTVVAITSLSSSSVFQYNTTFHFSAGFKAENFHLNIHQRRKRSRTYVKQIGPPKSKKPTNCWRHSSTLPSSGKMVASGQGGGYVHMQTRQKETVPYIKPYINIHMQLHLICVFHWWHDGWIHLNCRMPVSFPVQTFQTPGDLWPGGKESHFPKSVNKPGIGWSHFMLTYAGRISPSDLEVKSSLTKQCL